MLGTAVAPWPDYSEEEASVIADILRSGRVNQWTGQEVRKFESEFATFCGARHAVAVANGTLALDLALRALGIGQGDEVIVTPRTFIASVSSVVLAGAVPIFADVERHSGNISARTIEAVLTPRTRAIIPVHLAGWPCDMPAIMQLAREHSVAVIEDCAQAHGARINGQMVGSFGHAGAWSFCQDKVMTTGGEGGMVTTNDRECWSLMWSFKDHGKSWEAVYEREHPPGFRWLHESFGTNWRMMEMPAAIGRIQLGRMPDWTERRNRIASRFREILVQFPNAIRIPWPDDDIVHAFYRLYAYVRLEGLRPGWTRDRIVMEAIARGVPLYQGTCSEVYLEKAFDGTGFRPAARLPNARDLGETSLMFLTHPSLTDAQVDHISSTLTTILEEASA